MDRTHAIGDEWELVETHMQGAGLVTSVKGVSNVLRVFHGPLLYNDRSETHASWPRAVNNVAATRNVSRHTVWRMLRWKVRVVHWLDPADRIWFFHGPNFGSIIHQHDGISYPLRDGVRVAPMPWVSAAV